VSHGGSPFVVGARVILRSAGESDLAVGTLRDVQPELWTVELAEPIEPGTFGPGSGVVITTPAAGGLASARSQLLRRSHGVFVIARPQGHEHQDRRRDARLPAQGMVGWAGRGVSGVAQVLDVSRSGMKIEVGRALRVGESVVLDVTEDIRVSALVVGITDDGRDRHAHVAFTRITDDERRRVVEAFVRDAPVDIDLTGAPVFEVPA
jgi:hypothetical protein